MSPKLYTSKATIFQLKRMACHTLFLLQKYHRSGRNELQSNTLEGLSLELFLCGKMESFRNANKSALFINILTKFEHYCINLDNFLPLRMGYNMNIMLFLYIRISCSSYRKNVSIREEINASLK